VSWIALGLEEERRRKEEAKAQAGGKSLFEILEANKDLA